MLMNVITFFACYLSGLFVGTFIWTFLENYSKAWRQLTRRVTRAIPWTFRRMIMWVMILVLAYIGYFVVPWGYTRGGIFTGMAAGIFVYMKAGVTLGKSNISGMEGTGKAGKGAPASKGDGAAAKSAAVKKPKRLK